MTGGMMFKNDKWACEHGSDDYFYVAREDGQSFSKDERKAVEKLIEAAPELLEALMLGYEGIMQYDGQKKLKEIMRAAIAKALGEQE